MSLDRRLRDAFEHAATAAEPDVETHLDQTLRRAARRRQQAGLGRLVAAAAGVALLVVLVRLGVPFIGPGASSPTPVGSGMEAVAGVYATTLQASDQGVVGDLDLTGTWEIELLANGLIKLVPPASFEGSRAEGHTYTVAGATLRTDLYFNDYCDSVGEYTWSISGGDLTLTAANDGCELRRTLLSTRAWHSTE